MAIVNTSHAMMNAHDQNLQASPSQRLACKCSSSTRTSKQPSISQSRTPPSRFSCDFAGCSSSFRRVYDLVRHKKTIHGPKHRCVHQPCKYATAREDKMNEHVKKIHPTSEQTSPAQFNISSPQPSPSTSIPNQIVDFAFNPQDEGYFGMCGADWQGGYSMMEAETYGMMAQDLNPMPYQMLGFGESGYTGTMYGNYTDFVLYS